MRAFVAALVPWSFVVLAVTLFVPWSGGGLLGCMHLVVRSLGCEAQQSAINQVWWEYKTAPILVAMASGYIAIAIVRLVGVRRKRSDLATRTLE
jgi:hypothetical protein